MPFATIEEAQEAAAALRAALEPHFSADTAGPSGRAKTPSAGHCAVVSLLVRLHAGGSLVSTRLEGVSHWLNRVDIGGEEYDLDATGDQFGGNLVGLARAGTLYPDVRVRADAEVKAETIERAIRLATRAHLTHEAGLLAGMLAQGV